MRVHLFVPCYVDQLYPQVGIATLRLLEHYGCEVIFPEGQACCGQPMANAGMERTAVPTYRNTVAAFAEADYIVCPSGSCTHHVKDHYDVLEQTPAVARVRTRIYELCEFLYDVLQVTSVPGRLPQRVGLHQSCHGLRGLRLGPGSERRLTAPNKVSELLARVEDIELVEPERPDECCGFGGTFAVAQEALSVRMGEDKVADHTQAAAQVITSTDMSCLMHLEGVLRRQGSGVRVLHVAEVLAYGRC